MSRWSLLWSFSVSLSCLNSSTFHKSVSVLVPHLAPPAWELIFHRLSYFQSPTQSPAELPAKMLQNTFTFISVSSSNNYLHTRKKEPERALFYALKIYQKCTQTHTKGVVSILKGTPCPICHESILSIRTKSWQDLLVSYWSRRQLSL